MRTRLSSPFQIFYTAYCSYPVLHVQWERDHALCKACQVRPVCGNWKRRKLDCFLSKKHTGTHNPVCTTRYDTHVHTVAVDRSSTYIFFPPLNNLTYLWFTVVIIFLLNKMVQSCLLQHIHKKED